MNRVFAAAVSTRIAGCAGSMVTPGAKPDRGSSAPRSLRVVDAGCSRSAAQPPREMSLSMRATLRDDRSVGGTSMGPVPSRWSHQTGTNPHDILNIGELPWPVLQTGKTTATAVGLAVSAPQVALTKGAWSAHCTAMWTGTVRLRTEPRGSSSRGDAWRRSASWCSSRDGPSMKQSVTAMESRPMRARVAAAG